MGRGGIFVFLQAHTLGEEKEGSRSLLLEAATQPALQQAVGGLASVSCKVMHERERFGRGLLGCLESKLDSQASGLEVARTRMHGHF